MTPLAGLRQKKNAEVKRAFFEAAMELFREKGFEETSVDEIAERAGFSRATFFNHFGTKQGVLRYFGERIQHRIQELLAEADPSQSPLEQIRQVLFLMAREAEANREDVKLVYVYSLQDPDYRKGSTPARQRVWEILTDLVERSQRGGQIRTDMPARELSLHLLSMHYSTLLAIVTGRGSAEHVCRSVWQFILGGIRGEHPTAE